MTERLEKARAAVSAAQAALVKAEGEARRATEALQAAMNEILAADAELPHATVVAVSRYGRTPARRAQVAILSRTAKTITTRVGYSGEQKWRQDMAGVWIPYPADSWCCDLVRLELPE